MVKSKSKTPLKFTWAGNVGNELMCSVGKYTLQVWANRNHQWRWSVWERGKVIQESRATGYRRLHTAQLLAESACVALNKGKTA